MTDAMIDLKVAAQKVGRRYHVKPELISAVDATSSAKGEGIEKLLRAIADAKEPVSVTPAIERYLCHSSDGDHWDQRPAGTVIDLLLLHHTASGGGPKAIVDYWKGLRSPKRTSAHYVVGKDGLIIIAVPEQCRAWQAGASSWHGESDVNNFSIGVEICNLGDGKDPYPDRQLWSLAWLCRSIMHNNPAITLGPLKHWGDGRFESMGDITEHEAVSLSGKVDLKPNFPWQKLHDWIVSLPAR